LGDLYLSGLATDPAINLFAVAQFTTASFRKNILDWYKIRRKIQQKMTVSSTHNSKVWNFVEGALVGFSGFTKIASYYFCMRCEENYGIDGIFNHLWMCHYAAIIPLAF
jgi:hypothetical protein